MNGLPLFSSSLLVLSCILYGFFQNISCSCLHSGPEWTPNWQIWKYFLNLQLSWTGNYWLKLLGFFSLDFFLTEPCYVHLVLPTISVPAFSLSLPFVGHFPLIYPLNINSPSLCSARCLPLLTEISEQYLNIYVYIYIFKIHTKVCLL